MDFGLVFLGILLFATSVFMMLLILVQRGKGGGLTGALGGMGGQSAFGSKAGDVFTRITVITAIIWITLCMLTIAIYNPPPRDATSTKKDVPMTMSSTDDKESDENAEDSSSEANGDAAGDEITPDDVDEELSGLITDDENAESSDSEEDASADSTDESDDDGPSLEGNDEDGAEADSEEDNN